MSELADQNIERLSHLFASGNLGHAREIAQRLSEEIGEPRRSGRPEFGLISRLLAAAALGRQPARPFSGAREQRHRRLTEFARSSARELLRGR